MHVELFTNNYLTVVDALTTLSNHGQFRRLIMAVFGNPQLHSQRAAYYPRTFATSFWASLARRSVANSNEAPKAT
jgi:hypothetical protein